MTTHACGGWRHGPSPLAFDDWLDRGIRHVPLCFAGLLEGNLLAVLLAQAGSNPRVFLVDYWEPFASQAAKINTEAAGNSFQYAGRALLYKR